MRKILFIITISLFLLFIVGQTVQAEGLLLKYPEIKGTTPTSEGLPGFIKYIYLFALGAAGFVALLAILIGAIMYVFSAGNPSKAADAKERILSALLGILILLASVLILRTINPDLVDIGFILPAITPTGNGENGNCPYAQCYISRFNLCSSDENLYRGCVQSHTTNTEEARQTCMEYCENQAIQLGGGIPHCNVYSNQSQCQATGCH